MDESVPLPDHRRHRVVHQQGHRGAPRVFHNSRTLSEHGIITMPYLKNLDRITKDRVTLIGLPLHIIGAEASPVRAVVLL
jgi:kynurenine formamidase